MSNGQEDPPQEGLTFEEALQARLRGDSIIEAGEGEDQEAGLSFEEAVEARLGGGEGEEREPGPRERGVGRRGRTTRPGSRGSRAREFASSAGRSPEDIINEFRRGQPSVFQLLGMAAEQTPAVADFLMTTALEGTGKATAEAMEEDPQAISGIGGITTGLGKPVVNLAELPAEVAQSMNDAAENFGLPSSELVEKAAGGYLNLTEGAETQVESFSREMDRIARAAGASPREVVGAKLSGNLMGFAVPLVGSFKVADRVTRLSSGTSGLIGTGLEAAGRTAARLGVGPQALGRAAAVTERARQTGVPGLFLRDFTAGSLLGLGTTEGDISERIEAAKEEGAFFGAWSLVLGGGAAAVKGFRLKRMSEKVGRERVDRLLGREVEMQYNKSTGAWEIANLQGREGRNLLQVMSEEQMSAQSGEARRVLQRTADERALVPAIRGMGEGEARTGVIEGVKDPETSLEKLRAEFPELSFEVSQGPRATSIVFGPEDDVSQIAARFGRDGMFEGQRTIVGGQEMEYVRKLGGEGEAEGRAVLRRLDSGEEVTVPFGMAERGSLPFGTEAEVPREIEELAGTFSDRYFERLQEVMKQRSAGIDQPSGELERMAREGEISMSDLARRDFPTPEHINMAEALRGGESVRQVPDEELTQLLGEQGVGAVSPVPPAEPVDFQAFAREFLREEGLISERVRGLQLSDGQGRMAVAARDEGQTPVLQFLDESGQPVESVRANTFDELERIAADEGFGVINRDATVVSEDRPTLDAFTAQAYKNVRRRRHEAKPQFLREHQKQMRDEVLRVVEDRGPSLKMEAAQNGFNVRKLGDGQVELQEVNSGTRLTFQSEEDAIEALGGVQRRLGNDAGRTLTPRLPNDVPFTSHMPEAGEVFVNAADSPGDVERAFSSWPRIASNRERFIRLEEKTGLPLWSRGFEDLDVGMERASNEAGPWIRRAMDNWKNLSRKQRGDMEDFIREIEGMDLSRSDVAKIGRDMGLSGNQVQAYLDAADLQRALFRETGLPEYRHLQLHFSRIRPQLKDNGTLPEDMEDFIPSDLPREARPFFEKYRTGELDPREQDPLMVQMKYIRSLQFEKHLRGPWERAREQIGSRENPFNIRDLPEAQQQALLDEFVSMEGVQNARNVFKETLGRFRGMPSEGQRSVNRVLEKFGEKMPGNVGSEQIRRVGDIVLANMYGTAMGARPGMVARNSIQMWSTSYAQFGGRSTGEGIANLHDHPEDLAQRAIDAGALRPQQRGVFAGEEILQGEMGEINPNTPLGKAAKTAVLGPAFWAGEKLRSASSISLVPFSSVDFNNRLISFSVADAHFKRYYDMMQRGSITKETFLEESMPAFSAAVRHEAARRLDLRGEMSARDFIGKQAADKAQVNYNRYAQPLMLQGDVGKFGGMFGSFPLWMKDFVASSARNSSWKQRSLMSARLAAMAGALFVTGDEMGFDLTNWFAPASFLGYTGGPAVQMAQDLFNVYGNVTWNQGEALESARSFADNFQGIMLPGHGLARDITVANDQEDMMNSVLSMFLGRPTQQRDFFMEELVPFTDRHVTPLQQTMDILQETTPEEVRKGVREGGEERQEEQNP